MDDLLREFLTETSESLDTVDNQLVRFEQEPNNAKILDNIFRLVHTIKGTCGFLGLPRLEALAHAGETLMGKFRDGMPVTGQAVTLILTTIDRIKEILGQLEATEAEPDGSDQDLIDELQEMVERGMEAMSAPAEPVDVAQPAAAVEPAVAQGSLVPQTLERPLRPGEVSLDELERAFRETAIEVAPRAAPKPAGAARRVSQRGEAGREGDKTRGSQIGRRGGSAGGRQGRQPVDPRQRGYAGTSDDDGVGTGSDPQSAAGDLQAQRGHRVQGAAAAAVQRHRRAAGRRHEDADAADRQCLAEAAAHRARPLGRTRQADRTGDARRRHRARPPGARPDQGSAHPYGAQLRRPRAGDPGRAGRRRQARAGHHPAVRLS